MSIINTDYVKNYITHNQIIKKHSNDTEYTAYEPVSYRWTHGATDTTMGDGLLIYSLIHYMRAKVCVCLGSGGGFIPRIMTQARIDLYDAGIFEGDRDYSWGDIGTTYIVDADNGVNGYVDWNTKDSFLNNTFYPRVIIDTTENAYYNFFVKEDIKIDYLHIDAGHSYEDIKRDFELYTKLLTPHSIVSIHDTDSTFEDDYIVTDDIKEEYYSSFTEGPTKFVNEMIGNSGWEIFNLFNNRVYPEKPASSGLTLLQRKKIW